MPRSRWPSCNSSCHPGCVGSSERKGTSLSGCCAAYAATARSGTHRPDNLALPPNTTGLVAGPGFVRVFVPADDEIDLDIVSRAFGVRLENRRTSAPDTPSSGYGRRSAAPCQSNLDRTGHESSRPVRWTAGDPSRAFVLHE